jgi:hypothetical protein
MKWREVTREETSTKPVQAVKPLTPPAARRRAKRQDNVQQRIQTTQGIQALRLQNLRAKLDQV